MKSQKQKIPSSVLIVDDSEEFRMVYETILKAMGVYDIKEASDGIVGYREFAMNKYDLVIMSYQLPRKSGLDVLADMKATRLSARIIILTAENDKRTVMNCINAGADYFIQKDLSVKELKAKLKEVFNKIL
ncbi:MAG: response regulator [Opitutales bacterium]|nr:response regulator [Opitutales bacterium]